MQEKELIPYLFRTEFRKIVSVLCKTLGLQDMDAAEDIAGETFLAAMEVWPYKGLPPNPTAWLYTTAKNKTSNYLRRRKIFEEKVASQITPMDSETSFEPDLSENNISDSQLRMLFAICHPAIPQESQVGMALRILCGFGIDEIASAFLTSKETVNKRLLRAKEKLREEKISMKIPSDNELLIARMESVLKTIYLLFNEGYYSENDDAVIREDLCLEAMRLAVLLTDDPRTDLPEVSALLALMCFHASRFRARKNGTGEIVLYADQDESLWDQDLIARGGYYMKRSSGGKTLSKFHLEAAIAYWHTRKEESSEKWESILQLYNKLLQIEYSPVAALNRTYALSKANGTTQAIQEAEKLKLEGNPFYYSLLGELYSSKDIDKAKLYFEKAITCARTFADRRILEERIRKSH